LSQKILQLCVIRGGKAPPTTVHPRNHSAQNLEINEFISLKSYFPQQLQTHASGARKTEGARTFLHMPAQGKGPVFRTGARGIGPPCVLKITASYEICKSTSFNFAFSQNANSK